MLSRVNAIRVRYGVEDQNELNVLFYDALIAVRIARRKSNCTYGLPVYHGR